MALKAFNLKNQKLDSDKLVEILRFGTNDYSGAFGEQEPEFISGTGILNIPENTNLLVGGHLILNDSLLSHTYNMNNDAILVMALDLEDEKNYTNITTDTISNWGIGYLQGSSLDLNDETGNYKIIYGNKSIDDYHYQTIYWNDIILSPSSVSKGYIIPLMGKYNNEVVQLLGYKTGYELEEFLTVSAINKLLTKLSNIYTQQSGAIINDAEGDNINAGSVGALNVNNRRILSRNNNIVHIASNLQLATPKSNTGEVVGFNENRFGDPEPSDQTKNLSFSKVSSYSDIKKYYIGSDDKPITNTISRNTVLMTDDNFIVTTGVPSVSQGGTGATTKASARQNLGIYSGADAPEVFFENNGIEPSTRDIYFKIIVNS